MVELTRELTANAITEIDAPTDAYVTGSPQQSEICWFAVIFHDLN